MAGSVPAPWFCASPHGTTIVVGTVNRTYCLHTSNHTCTAHVLQVDALEAELASLRAQLTTVQDHMSQQSAALSAHAARVASQLGSQEELLTSLEARDAAIARTRQVRSLKSWHAGLCSSFTRFLGSDLG